VQGPLRGDCLEAFDGEERGQETHHVFNYFADLETTRLLFCEPKFKQIQKDVVASLKMVIDKNII